MGSLDDSIFKMRMIARNEPADYFANGDGAQWLLLIAEGIQNLQAHTLRLEEQANPSPGDI